ncbi:MAG: hypothetical protein RMJ43_11345 [Chloroherpetonaceae bacterium]|nr:hypothetical protein [Chthonomonadaceae bacterium]MDW8208424.1 hypothetical protein [Chloroherpetonaceae bacterium]
MAGWNPPADIADLLHQATPEAATQLRDIAEMAPDRERRKAAKRALYLLSQKHILPVERSEPVAPTTVLQAPADALRAFASAFDGAGNRLLIFLIPQPDGGNPLLSHILINDARGIRDYGGQRVPRRQIEARISDMERGMERGLAIAEIEPDYGRFLLAEARAIHQRDGTMTPAGFLDLLPLIGMPRQEYERPAVYAHLSPEEVLSDPTVPHDPEKLFATVWFENWFLDVNEVIPWLYRYVQAMQSPIELPESARAERRARSLAEATEGLLPAPVRRLYVRRLEETADILQRRSEREAARMALYHAGQLAEDKPVSEVPFARFLVERSWAVAYHLLREQAEHRGDIPTGVQPGA